MSQLKQYNFGTGVAIQGELDAISDPISARQKTDRLGTYRSRNKCPDSRTEVN